MTLYLHERHRVVGRLEDDFEAAFRDAGGWMDRLGQGDDARLVWYANRVHGTGPSYHVVTITAVRDGAAWERLARRVHDGDLRDWTHDVDTLRHDVSAKLLLPVAWSPIGELDLSAVPTEPAAHETSLFMEDTGWPSSSLEDYIDFWERDYLPMLSHGPVESRLLEIQACWVTALGAGRRPEGVLWQRVHDLDKLLALFTTETPPAFKGPGSYMATALEYRDQWRSRLLRTSSWSPRW
jgi:hypothetical protein